ncbi:MAG: MoxR family ATPase [Bacteroidota bacterium]
MHNFEIDLHSDSFHNKQAHPQHYILDPDLAGAVSVAITLNQPLLLTGEPGTGKTRLAHKIAWDLSQKYEDFLPEPLIYHTKTTSIAQDMFYVYDALRHFHDANLKKVAGQEAPPTSDYVDLRALGKAIALTQEGEISSGRFVTENSPRSSVVLIDEIDKAPRDFPNDILHEIENMEFEIKEANGHRIRKGNQHRIILILTSNSEKHLPEPFLRRCVYYNIPFPEQERLMEIVRSQLGEQTVYADEELVEHFLTIREQVKKKKPATAELIAWLRILEVHRFLENGLDFRRLTDSQRTALKLSYSVLAKNREDLQTIERWALT